VALTLMQAGFSNVRPLKRGFNALLAIGYPIELKQPSQS